MTLNADKYSRSVSLLCPTCGGSQFSHDDADASTSALVKCEGCGLEISKDDLVRANSENVDEHVKEIGQEVVKDIEKELRESLKKAFSGSKNFRIK
ncbi:hypothetical protein [Variovorax sp. OV084]|uniref:ECs_2282 family putative zinc-binding protein n=1 Tax=Variovorax sp. OV084 TaxID=1882777 RepID=UPI0008D3902C|nr:hypothetical protein [Variovorax sp. OV084]SEU21808.1 hypothetical protein SAMN05443580_13128 [Variovorax sp. OV084]